MVGATGEMRLVNRFIRGFGRGFLGIIFGVPLFGLIPFLFDRFGVSQIKEVGDGRLHTPEIRWVRAGIDRFL